MKKYLLMWVLILIYGCHSGSSLTDNNISEDNQSNITIYEEDNQIDADSSEDNNVTVYKGDIHSIFGGDKIVIQDKIYTKVYGYTEPNTEHIYHLFLEGSEPQLVKFNANVSSFISEDCRLTFFGITNQDKKMYFMEETSYETFIDSGEYMLHIECESEEESKGYVDYILQVGTDSNFNYIFDENEPIFIDNDGDNVNDSRDNCVGVYNPSQSDLDHDRIGDACDNEANFNTIEEVITLPTEYLKITRTTDGARELVFMLDVDADGVYALKLSDIFLEYQVYDLNGSVVGYSKGFAEGDESMWSYYLKKGQYFLVLEIDEYGGYVYTLEIGNDTDEDFIIDALDSCVGKKNYFLGDVNVTREEWLNYTPSDIDLGLTRIDYSCDEF
ncbi:MAG: hypothetical protein GXO60_07940 [Epsilonproteobacteria bacterium]|nr:hypothetical protein [Campylobacterota bacterium]